VNQYRKEREESASKVLQEFDTMRKSVEDERKAMRELMEKERSQRWTPMQRYPAYPAWQGGGYQPYPPAYNPYGYGYPQY
jgi:hypothetical protein